MVTLVKEFHTINYFRYKNERTTSYPEMDYEMGNLSETSASGGNIE